MLTIILIVLVILILGGGGWGVAVLNMLPSLSPNYVRDGSSVNPVLCPEKGKGVPLVKFFTKPEYRCRCENCGPDFFAVRLPPFGNLVSGIVGISPQEKVARVNTGRIVAAMQNAQVLRNCPNEKCIRNSGSGYGPIFPAAAIDAAVPFFVDKAGPQNATSGSYPPDVAKKPFFKRLRMTFTPARSGAKLSSTISYFAGEDSKGFPTKPAYANNFRRFSSSHDMEPLAKVSVLVRAGQQLSTASPPAFIILRRSRPCFL